MTSSADSLHPLPWDSNFLGFGVARLAARALPVAALAAHLAAARQAGLRLLYVVADPADTLSNASAQAVGGWLADRKVTFVMPVAAVNGAVSPCIVPETVWSARLESLALQSGEYSRYRLDPKFDPLVFKNLYQQWLRNSLAHELAREVLVYRPLAAAASPEPPQPLGLMTLGVKAGRADIGLLAVDAAARGQRIGQQLVAAARQRAAAWHLPALQVVTQLDNDPACRFYHRCGFVQEAVEIIYHVWL